MLELTPRLKIIADSINIAETVADIGSDHAYLPIYLVLNKKVKKVIASDINNGPVKLSQKRIRVYGAESNIEVRKGNGLAVLGVGEAEVIVIAGMGGILIEEILTRDTKIATAAKTLILQPMRDSDRVRKWLQQNNFRIIEEELVREEHKIYEIIWAEYSNENVNRTYSCLPEDLMLVGKRIIDKKHLLAGEFVDKKISEMQKIIDIVKVNDTPNTNKRLVECQTILKYYIEVRKWLQ